MWRNSYGTGKRCSIGPLQDDAEIRFFEQRVVDAYSRGLVPGLAHLYIGEEAVAAGVCGVLREDGYITSTHRGHGHVIAKGADLKLMIAELNGKITGYWKGRAAPCISLI